MSEQLELIYKAFMNKQVPKQWENAAYPSLKPLASWVKDLVLRIDFIKVQFRDLSMQCQPERLLLINTSQKDMSRFL